MNTTSGRLKQRPCASCHDATLYLLLAWQGRSHLGGRSSPDIANTTDHCNEHEIPRVSLHFVAAGEMCHDFEVPKNNPTRTYPPHTAPREREQTAHLLCPRRVHRGADKVIGTLAASGSLAARGLLPARRSAAARRHLHPQAAPTRSQAENQPAGHPVVAPCLLREGGDARRERPCRFAGLFLTTQPHTALFVGRGTRARAQWPAAGGERWELLDAACRATL